MEKAPAEFDEAKKAGDNLLRPCGSWGGEIAEDHWKWKQLETLQCVGFCDFKQ